MTKTVCCLLFAFSLWAVLAAGVSDGSEDVVDLPPNVRAAQAAGEVAVEEQTYFAGDVGALLLTVRDVMGEAREAAAGDDKNAKKILEEVEKVEKTAQTLKTAGDEALAAVRRADGKTKHVVEEAANLAVGAPGVEATKERAEEWKRMPSEVAQLWRDAMERAASQLSEAEKLLAEIGGARTAAINANSDNDAAPTNEEQKRKNEHLEERLNELSESIQNAKGKAENLQALVQMAGEKTKEAAEEVSEQVAKESAKANALKPPPRDPSGGSENPTKNDDSGAAVTNDPKTPPQGLPAGTDNNPTKDVGGNTGTGPTSQGELNEGSSSDGNSLTVSCLTATSVLSLYFARVAAVVITV